MGKKRKIEEAGINAFIEPDQGRESYSRHVKMRARTYCFVLYAVALLCLKYKPTKNYKLYMSDIADVQFGQGVYNEHGKRDAAHLCNTSFLLDMFLSNIAAPVSPEFRIYCERIRSTSGATTTQFKSDNVGPDKVIDTFQTRFKNETLEKAFKDQKAPSGRQLYLDYIAGLNLALSTSKSGSFSNPKSGGYQAGKRARSVMQILDSGTIPWDVEEEFSEIKKAVDKL